MLCRLRKFLRIKSHAKFAKKMGKFRVNADLNFPIGFRQIEERTHQDWFTAEDAITNHSILPYHRRFNPEESYQRWRQDALEGKHGVSKSMGLNRFPPFLKACPLCIKADLEAGKKPGAETEPYYRRYHQLAGAEACFIHGLKLVALRVQNRTRLPYIPLADSLADFEA